MESEVFAELVPSFLTQLLRAAGRERMKDRERERAEVARVMYGLMPRTKSRFVFFLVATSRLRSVQNRFSRFCNQSSASSALPAKSATRARNSRLTKKISIYS